MILSILQISKVFNTLSHKLLYKCQYELPVEQRRQLDQVQKALQNAQQELSQLEMLRNRDIEWQETFDDMKQLKDYLTKKFGAESDFTSSFPIIFSLLEGKNMNTRYHIDRLITEMKVENPAFSVDGILAELERMFPDHVNRMMTLQFTFKFTLLARLKSDLDQYGIRINDTLNSRYKHVCYVRNILVHHPMLHSTGVRPEDLQTVEDLLKEFAELKK